MYISYVKALQNCMIQWKVYIFQDETSKLHLGHKQLKHQIISSGILHKSVRLPLHTAMVFDAS